MAKYEDVFKDSHIVKCKDSGDGDIGILLFIALVASVIMYVIN